MTENTCSQDILVNERHCGSGFCPNRRYIGLCVRVSDKVVQACSVRRLNRTSDLAMPYRYE